MPSTANVEMIVVGHVLGKENVLQDGKPEAKLSFRRFHLSINVRHRCDSLPLTFKGNSGRTHQWMHKLQFASTKDDFNKFKAEIFKWCLFLAFLRRIGLRQRIRMWYTVYQ